MSYFLSVGGAIVLTLVLVAVLSMILRRVVPTNMVHVVQSRAKKVSYGTNHSSNVYWAFPSWVPWFGVTVMKLPVSNFGVDLKSYEAFDIDKVPFVVDVASFFVISDTSIAAERIESFKHLHTEITKIVQGAVRKILANAEIKSIMSERSVFGDKFTQEVEEDLRSWGCSTVKSMELMDIRDAKENGPISDIMAMKQSGIEKDSRTTIAVNNRDAEKAEIEAKESIDIRAQEAERRVGEATAENEKLVGIAKEESRQKILIQEKETSEKKLDVERVNEVRNAQIQKDKEIISAEQEKETKIIKAEGELIAVRRQADGIKAIGEATADADKLKQLAPVEAQIVLAKEIGTNQPFQQYLVALEAIAAQLKVGVEQAVAMQNSEIKVIANSGDVNSGVGNVMGLLSSKTGTNLAALLEGLSQGGVGEEVLSGLMKNKSVVKPALVNNSKEVEDKDS